MLLLPPHHRGILVANYFPSITCGDVLVKESRDDVRFSDGKPGDNFCLQLNRAPCQLGFRAVFLRDFFAFAGKWPFAVEGLGLFADRRRYVDDLEVFKDMYA